MGRPSKRNEIIEAAARLIADKGLEGVSFRDVARASGVQTASVYRQFSSKDELFEEVLHYILGESAALRRGFLTSDATPAEKVKASIYYAIRDAAALDPHRKILQRALVDNDQFTLRVIQKIGGDLQTKLVVGAIKALDTGRDPYFTFYILISQVLGYLDMIPIFNLMRPLKAKEQDPAYLTDHILAMQLPEIDWQNVKLIR